MSDIGNPIAVGVVTGNPDAVTAKLSRGARMICELETEEAPLIGYVTVGIFADGTYSLGFKTPEDHVIGATLFTAYVKEVIQREMTGQFAAEDYVRDHL